MAEISAFLKSGEAKDEEVPAEKEQQVEMFLKQFDKAYFEDEESKTFALIVDLLSMLQLHVNVSLASPLAQQMLLSLASPYHIGILLQLLVVVPPFQKLRIIKILDCLRQNKLPRQLFDDAVKPLLEERQDLVFLQHL